MSLSRSAIESLSQHDFGWRDLRCEAPRCKAPADGSFEDHYYCHKHLKEKISQRPQQGTRVSSGTGNPLPLSPSRQGTAQGPNAQGPPREVI